jgi:glycosyltransferase involved in cell wall biosynthesis
VTRSSAKPTLGIVTWDFLEAKGGLGRSIEWFAKTLCEDFSVVVGAPVGSDELSVMSYKVMPLLSFTKRLGGHILFSLCLPFVLSRWIRKQNVDVLLIPSGPGGVLLIRKPKIPYIVATFHLYEQQAHLVPGQWWKKVFIPFEASTYRSARAVFCFNKDAQKILQNFYHISVHQLHLLPHAIDLQKWNNHLHSKVKGLCVCVARLEARKGVDLLLKAWPSIVHQIPFAHLVIVGRGILATRIDRMMKRMPSVRRYASLNDSDLVSLVQRAELSVSPTYLEGFGLTVAEAMSAGTVVVCAESEGVRCLIEDKITGYLWKSGDEKSLAEAIIDALKQDDQRKTIAQRATQEAALRFDPTQASEMLRSTVKEVL